MVTQGEWFGYAFLVVLIIVLLFYIVDALVWVLFGENISGEDRDSK